MPLRWALSQSSLSCLQVLVVDDSSLNAETVDCPGPGPTEDGLGRWNDCLPWAFRKLKKASRTFFAASVPYLKIDVTKVTDGEALKSTQSTSDPSRACIFRNTDPWRSVKYFVGQLQRIDDIYETVSMNTTNVQSSNTHPSQSRTALRPLSPSYHIVFLPHI